MGWAFRTLDGAGTFHGMGIQNTGWCWDIPWDGHYRCSHSWHKTSQSHTPRSHCNTRDSVMHHGQSLYVILMLLSSICHWPMRQCCRTSLLRTKARYSTFLGRYPGPYLGWSQMMQSVCDGIYPDQSPFLPMIDMDPTNMSCIFLHSSLARRYGATPVLIFDQPCGKKPRRSLTMSHLTVSHGPSSYGLGDFTQK